MQVAVHVFNTTVSTDVLLCPSISNPLDPAEDQIGPCADCGGRVQWSRVRQASCIHVCLVCAALRLTGGSVEQAAGASAA